MRDAYTKIEGALAILPKQRLSKRTSTSHQRDESFIKTHRSYSGTHKLNEVQEELNKIW